MSTGVSVVICCHNSAARLPETLRHLTAQQVPDGLPWEVVVIDNASTDATADIARQCWAAMATVPLRVVSEPQPGIGNARFRSFTEASHELVSFLDDDNWAPPDWITKVVAFFETHPEAAVVGGPSRGAFEKTPPSWFADISLAYAVGDQHEQSGDITDRIGTLLWTAGMSMRRARLLELVENGFRFIACSDPTLPTTRGEDSELCYALREIGARIYYDTGMRIEHFMPADRLTWPRALKLAYHMGEASPVIELFLIALDRPTFDVYPEWKKTWGFQMLKALGQWVAIIFKHPLACVFQPEGSADARRFQIIRGRLATLGRLRGRYQETRRRIRDAATGQKT